MVNNMKDLAFKEFAKTSGKQDSEEMRLYFEAGWDRASEFWKKEFERIVIRNKELQEQVTHCMGSMWVHGIKLDKKMEREIKKGFK